MLYSCDMCGADVEFDSTKKLLDKRYCMECISKARSERRKKLNSTTSQKKKRAIVRKEKREEELRLKRVEDAERNSLENIVEELAAYGPRPLTLPNMPIRLKRNERVYFLAGRASGGKFSIALALTNQRLFFVKTEKLLRTYTGKKCSLSITHRIKTIPLSSVIAIDVPDSNLDYSEWKITLHLDNGKDVPVGFDKSRGARLFYALLAEMVDRLNDPIDDSAFSPKRERILDDVKVAVWRRDGGVCARCGSQENLEYDHIIPVSKGGSNTLRNIELLCESCNRKKSNRVL